MSNLLTIRQNDTRPYHRVALTYTDGSKVNLTSTVVRYKLRPVHTTLLTVDALANVIDDAEYDPTDGVVEYRWQDGDTDVAGLYDAEFEVTFGDFTVQTFPTRRPLRVRITGDLDSP